MRATKLACKSANYPYHFSHYFLPQVHTYFKTPPVYERLPICPYKDQILRTVKENPVTVITAPTGSGKSTRVPQYIMDDEYYNERRHFKIVVTQPRRVAAVALARRVLTERGLKPIDYASEGEGTLVGYQIGMDKQVNADTRLVYMTTGVLLRKLLNVGNLNEFTHIILDEVHERDKETDFLLLLVKKFLCTNSKFVKVVVMSATVNADKFSRYFSSLIGGVPRPCPTIELTDETYRVEVMYLDQFRSSLGYHREYEEIDRSMSPEISDEIYELARALIDSFDERDRIHHDDELTKGSVLVFLPGIYEIETCQKFLLQEAVSKTYDIIPLHSTIPRSSQMKVFAPPIPGRRKVILSTNIAESSITVPDIRYVVDFCLTKELVSDPGSGMSSLQCTWAPRSSLDQRKGRAGRVAAGICYRLVPRSFMSKLSDFTTPEIKRCSLEQLILWCKILDIGDPHHMLSLALDPPDLTKLYQSALVLEECGALTRPTNQSEPFSGEITFLGQAMGTLPLDVRLTRLVMFGYVFNCFTECIVMSACLSLPSFLEIPYSNKQDRMKAYVTRMRKAAGTFSDPIMMLHMYNAWYDAHSQGLAASRSFCRSNFIEFSRIQDVASLVRDLNSGIHRLNIPMETIQERKVAYEDKTYIVKLKLALAAANFPNYFVKNKDIIHEENLMHLFGDKSPSDTVFFTGMNLDVRSDEELEQAFMGDVDHFFRQGYCDPVKKLSLEGARLYVTFENPAERSVCKSVYYALMMKKQGFSLSLSEREDTISRREAASCQTEVKRTIPIIKGEAQVQITHVISPTKFYVQFFNNDLRSEWELTQQRLQQISRTRVPYQYLKPKGYAACFFDDEVTLYRVRLEHFKGEEMRVYYLDYGNHKTVPVNQLFRIPADLLAVPFQAIECSLENIAPLHSNFMDMVSGGWPRHVVQYTEEILLNKLFTARIFYVWSGVVHLDLIANEVSFINHLMTQFQAYQPEPDYRVKQARAVTNVLGIRLDTAFSVYEDTYTRPYTRPNITTNRAKLSGADSPYLVSFKGLSESLDSKIVTVEKSSVNSVVLHHNTALNYQELLTANSVALSSNNDKIQVRGSTSHDPIPGLPEIMVLLFAPQVQLHCSPGKLNYTGCIAGLGAVEGSSIWPEHDLKVKFDVRLDNRDLTAVNKLRMYISDLLQGDEDNPSTVHLTHQPIRQLQRKIWRLITELLQRRREFLPSSDYLNLDWEPPAGTENSELPSHNNNDVLKPFSVLQTRYRGITLETKEMSSRVAGLIESNYKLEETTGTRSAGGARTYCDLCGMHFERTITLATHLNGKDHAAEKFRLDHWTTPA